jgi:hypothetical protein
VGELLAERRNERPTDPRRTRWSRPGWHGRASAWIDEALRAAGWGAAGRIDQVRHWGISAVLRVEAEGGIAWFKAVFPGFDHEPSITALLDRRVPGLCAPVLAVDEKEGWLLLADVGSTFVSGDLQNGGPAIERLVAVQRQFVGRTAELAAAGCPDRRLPGLARALDAVLRDPDVLSWITVVPERVPSLAAWVDDAAKAIDELGIPDTLVHGDFHPGNVALVDGGVAIIDWSDAAVSNPFVDVLTWVDWTKDDPVLTEAVWDTFLRAWDGAADVAGFRARRATFEGLAAAYHTVSYAGIIAGLEPSHCPQHADGLQGYFGLLTAAVDHA